MNDRVLIEQHTPRGGGETQYMARHSAPPQTRPRRSALRRVSVPRGPSTATVELVDRINALSPEELREQRSRALMELRRGADRGHWQRILLLADQRLGGERDDFEQRLASAREALGRTSSSAEQRTKREAAEVRQSMEGSASRPDVVKRARAARASMEKTRPAARSSSSGSFEDRLAAAKAAIGRS
jgi:hypothetical protein